MPKVMIDGMEMPKNCAECRFCIYINSGTSLHCEAKQKEIPFKIDARSIECPLQEVKE